MSLLLNAQEVELLSALNAHHVQYLVVGGHAVIFHGYLRAAKDLDIWIEPNEKNAELLRSALAAVRVHLGPEHVARLGKPNLQMPIQSLYTELLTSVGDLVFEEALGRSSSTLEKGVPCHVLSLQDLLRCKKLLGRPSDLEDIQNLQEQSRRGV